MLKSCLLCLRYLNLQLLLLVCWNHSSAGDLADSIPENKQYKNVIRYNLSGALVSRWGGYFVIGYERVVNSRQSFSLNVGRTSFPNLIGIETDTYALQRDLKNGGYNLSADYRFYMLKENKFSPPRGLYIGPYFSYNKYFRKNEWLYKVDQSNLINTRTQLAVSTVGFQLGYQFIVWKRVAIDLIMAGPGIGFYRFEASAESTLSAEDKEKLYQALQALAAEKIPGLDYVFSSEEIGSNGVFRATNLGYRYILHVGFLF
jgi:hypothetical protein